MAISLGAAPMNTLPDHVDTRDEWEAAYLGEPPVVGGMAAVAAGWTVARESRPVDLGT